MAWSLLLLFRLASPNDDFVRTAALASPAMVTCPGRWLDFTSNLVVSDEWGPQNHFDGDHSFGPHGVNDFASCLQQCTNRSGCHMFHYGPLGANPLPPTLGKLPHKCGVPTDGLQIP